MKNSREAFENLSLSLFDTEKADLLESYADMTIGEIIDLGDTLKDIPVCRTFTAVIDTITTVRDGYLLQKLLIFLKKFNEGTVKEKTIEKRRIAAKNKEKWIRREIELILIRIDRISDKRNVDLLSDIYLAFLNGECTWDLFEETALILERFIYQDAEQLKRLYDSYVRSQKANGNSVISTMFENNHCDRLVALGLVWQKYTTVLNGAVNVEYCLTEAGRLLAGVLSKASDSAADFSCG